MIDVIIYGGGKFAGNIIDDFSDVINPVGYVDEAGNDFLTSEYGVRFLGHSIDRSFGIERVVLCIGSEKDLSPRERCFDEIKRAGMDPITLVHKTSFVSKRATICEGTIVQSLCTIQSNVTIGRGCIISSNSFIGHDSFINDFVFIGPGTNMGGSVSVGHTTHIGIGSDILQKIKIGNNCLVGASTCVNRDIRDGSKVWGVPGKVRNVETT
jgi:UDP-N-acetylbacillosamine N-acetyltransferase